MRWEEYQSVIYSQLVKGDIIAGFNLYGTLIDKDWNLLYDTTRDKLLHYHHKGYIITLFINKRTVTYEFKENIERLQRRLNIPMNVYIATQDDHYKKPMTGLWDLCQGKTGFICSDCAGRKYRKKQEDYNSNDIFFAYNIRVPFIYPEDLFEQPKRFFRIIEYPFIPTPMNDPFPWEQLKKETRNKKHIIIPICCVTYLRNTFINNFNASNYFIAHNIDELRVGLEENRNIIYNNNNPNRDNLYKHLPHKYQRILLYFDVKKEWAYHINEYNVMKQIYNRDPIWKYDKYYTTLKEPTHEEGVVYRIYLGHILKEIGKEYYYRYDIMKLI